MKKVLVLSGDGVNCERESARAFQDAGGVATIVHVNEFLSNPKMLFDYGILCLPGGFSFGDEVRSGKILAEKIRTHLPEVFEDFVGRGGLTIGICNGFQVLIQLGAFGGLKNPRTATLATNDHGEFRDRWAELELTEQAAKSPWFKGMKGRLLLPIRHKEGKIVLKDETAAKGLKVPLVYVEPVNGSHERSAALLDDTGQILGLMPHPEAATHAFLNPLPHPRISANENAVNVRKLFENAVNWSKQQ